MAISKKDSTKTVGKVISEGGILKWQVSREDMKNYLSDTRDDTLDYLTMDPAKISPNKAIL